MFKPQVEAKLLFHNKFVVFGSSLVMVALKFLYLISKKHLWVNYVYLITQKVKEQFSIVARVIFLEREQEINQNAVLRIQKTYKIHLCKFKELTEENF